MRYVLNALIILAVLLAVASYIKEYKSRDKEFKTDTITNVKKE